MRKYNNIKCKGYDSTREYRRSVTLKLLEKAGIISNLQEQVSYELIPAQYEHYTVQGARKLLNKKKLLEKSVHYIADFQYVENGVMVVEDVKGMRTTEYIIKRKLMLHVHGIKIKEV